MRVLAREQRRGRRRLAVRQGPLRLPGDPRRRAHHARRWCATAASCARSPGSARSRSAAGLARHRGRIGALVGGQATNEEGFLLARLLREGLDSADIDSRGRRRRARGAAPGHWPTRRCRRTSPTSSSPTPCWCSAASRRTTRRSSTCGSARASGAAASSWRSPPRARARSTRNAGVRRATRPARRPRSWPRSAPALAAAGGARRRDPPSSPGLLRDGGEDIVIVWGERIGADARRVPAARSPAGSGWPSATAPGCSRSRPAPTAAACARPACCPTPARATARSTAGLAATPPRSPRAAADGELTALYLFQTDPVRDQPDRALWERALHRAGLVVAHASVLTEGIREHANVIFPAESYAEKEGTVVHPDGRIQRLRTAIAPPRPGPRRAGRCSPRSPSRCGLDLGVLTAPMAFKQLVAAVPFYAGLTLEEIGGRGVRWPEREAARRRRVAADAERAGGAQAAAAHAPPARPHGVARRRTARCASAPTARSGPRPRSRSRRRCNSRRRAAGRALAGGRRAARDRRRRRGRRWRRTAPA